ncbi:MAG: hypothetical protein JWQ59_1030 [Cryobacterium sp.]|jgi:hypothetical protein|nr:hypothetical protein [Cryobacterium sp.]
MSDPAIEQPPLGVPDDPQTEDPSAPPSEEPAVTTDPDGTPKENPSG